MKFKIHYLTKPSKTNSFLLTTDEHIMYSVSNGDIALSASLFERYHVSMYNYFRKMNHDRSISEDLAQEVFVRMIKYRNSYKRDYKFKPWLYRIASNVRNDHFREQKIKYTSGEVPEIISQDENIVDLQIEESRKLQTAINSLKKDQREILVLSKLQKMKYAEIAKIKNTTESNIKTVVHRSIHRLRKYYQENNWL